MAFPANPMRPRLSPAPTLLIATTRSTPWCSIPPSTLAVAIERVLRSDRAPPRAITAASWPSSASWIGWGSVASPATTSTPSRATAPSARGRRAMRVTWWPAARAFSTT